MVEDTIIQKLKHDLQPVYLFVENESHNHNVAAGSETHFKVIAVADCFEGVLPVKRHQKVYGLLADELAGGVHALALHLFTPAQWSNHQWNTQSPKCMGGT